jgi:hypothetical protein
MVMNDFYCNKTHLKTIEVVSSQRNILNFLLCQKDSKTHGQNNRNSKILRELYTAGPLHQREGKLAREGYIADRVERGRGREEKRKKRKGRE